MRSGARRAEIILRLSNEDSNPCQRLLALINSCIYDLARLGVRVLSHTFDKNSFPLPTICSSPIYSTVVVHLPGKQEVVGSSPTGRADFSFFLSFLPLFLSF